mgnify:CR=1 FL=1
MKNDILPNPHPGFPVTIGAQQPLSLFFHKSTYLFAGAEMRVILRMLLLSEGACFMYLTVT